MLQSFFCENFLRAVITLCEHPLLQLELLECILEDRKLGIKVDDDLLLIYITLLCKLNYSDDVLKKKISKFYLKFLAFE